MTLSNLMKGAKESTGEKRQTKKKSKTPSGVELRAPLEETGKSRNHYIPLFPSTPLNRLCETPISPFRLFLGGIFFYLFSSLMILDYPPNNNHDSSSFKVGYCFYFPSFSERRKNRCSQSTHATKLKSNVNHFYPFRLTSGCASCSSRRHHPGGCTWPQRGRRRACCRRAPSQPAWYLTA